MDSFDESVVRIASILAREPVEENAIDGGHMPLSTPKGEVCWLKTSAVTFPERSHTRIEWSYALNALAGSVESMRGIFNEMGVDSSNAAHEAHVLVAVYLKFYHNQDHEHMDTPTFNHSKNAFLSALHTNSAAIQTQSSLPPGSWHDAFDQKNLRIHSDTIPIQNLNKINSILEEIRTIPIPQKLDALLESGENQAIAAILSTCYFSVLYFSFSQAANPLYRNLVILSPFANNIPLHWFNAEFFGALDFSLENSNDVNASLREAGISATIRLLLPWISANANSIGNSNIVVARLTLKIVEAHSFVCDPSVRLSDDALLAYGQTILKIYGNVSDEVDSKVSTAVVHFARTRLKQLSSSQSLKKISPDLSQYFATCPSKTLQSLTTALIDSVNPPVSPAEYYSTIRQIYETVCVARWEFIDPSLLVYEHGNGFFRRVYEAWIRPEGERSGKSVCVLPVWLESLMTGVTADIAPNHDVSIALVVVLAIIRTITSRNTHDTSKWSSGVTHIPSDAITHSLLKSCALVMTQAALILATSYSDALESNLAQTLFQFFGFHYTGNEALFEEIVLSSDSVTRSLLNVLMETLSDPFSKRLALNYVSIMTPQEIAVLSRALGTALSIPQQPKSEILRTLSQLSEFAKTLSLEFKSGAIQIPSQTEMKALQTAESKENEALSHLKTALFSFVMVSRILVQTINKQMQSLPNNAEKDEDARFRSSTFHTILHGLFDLHFVTCRFGLDAFPEWKDVFYGALDGSLSPKKASFADAFLMQFMPEQDDDGLPHFDLPRTLFYVLVVQHVLPYLDPKFLSEKVLPPIAPHLAYKAKGRSPDELDLFEMGHWIIFKLLNDMIIQEDKSMTRWRYKSILFGMASEYAGLLLQNLDSGDSVESTKRMFTALIRALSCFSSAHNPSHTNEDSNQHNRYNEIQMESAATALNLSSSGLPLEGARMGQRGGVRSFSAGVTGGKMRNHQSIEIAGSEEAEDEADVIENDEWNPWEGDDIGWTCVCNLVARIDDCTRVILEAERDRQNASGKQNDMAQSGEPNGLNIGKDANLREGKMTRLEEVFLAAPFMTEWIKRDGLMTILFCQLRAVGLLHLPKLQECIRSLILYGVSDVMSIEPNLKEGLVGIGLDVSDMSKSQLWTALFEVVSGDLFYDHVRQVLLVEWYMALVADARQMIAERKAKQEQEEKERRAKGIPKQKFDVVLRAKL
ncbi:hypothetical protein CcCBS67573_g05670 [Chytriomyces confervae]|uniref:Uncharacterized protein n=1 Tax=Chytriomyces confervae TaxID=246404 RepID=A0A507F9Q6_9FUNG|nr:hypothetical protein CcCBS67573_g05670 [Chytriomyces confervae]